MPAAPRELLPESLVMPPSDWCPNPSAWSSTDDESSEREVQALIGALIVATQPEAVLETGTAFAQTTRQIAGALDANGHGHGWTLDTNPARVEAARAMIQPRLVTCVLGSSTEWEPPDGVRFDFAFIDDVLHWRTAVAQHFRPWLNPGAIVCFHDMAPSFTTGPHAHGAGLPLVQALADEGWLRFVTLHTPRGLAIAEVIG